KLPGPSAQAGYDTSGFNRYMGFGFANMFRALGGLETATDYLATVVLRNSKTVLNNPSCCSSTSRHRFGLSDPGNEVRFTVSAEDVSGAGPFTGWVETSAPDST